MSFESLLHSLPCTRGRVIGFKQSISCFKLQSNRCQTLRQCIMNFAGEAGAFFGGPGFHAAAEQMGAFNRDAQQIADGIQKL